MKKQKDNNLQSLMKNVFKLLVRHYPTNTLEKFEEVSYLLKCDSTDKLEKFLMTSDIRNHSELASYLNEYTQIVQDAISPPPTLDEDGVAVPEEEPAPIGHC
jgi:hypothetical protein